MIQVRITGGRFGLEKESMIGTVREALGLGRAEAAQCADRVIEGKTAVLISPDRETALALVDALRALGADAEVAGE